MAEYHDPTTPEGWQAAADLAYALLQWLSMPNPAWLDNVAVVNIERCEELLRRAGDHGILPSEDAVQRILPALLTPREEGQS